MGWSNKEQGRIGWCCHLIPLTDPIPCWLIIHQGIVTCFYIPQAHPRICAWYLKNKSSSYYIKDLRHLHKKVANQYVATPNFLVASQDDHNGYYHHQKFKSSEGGYKIEAGIKFHLVSKTYQHWKDISHHQMHAGLWLRRSELMLGRSSTTILDVVFELPTPWS